MYLKPEEDEGRVLEISDSCLEKTWMQLNQSHNLGQEFTTHLVFACQPSVKGVRCWLENPKYQEKNKDLCIGKRQVRSEKAIK